MVRFSKGVVIAVIANTIVFSYAILYVFLKVGAEPSTLVACWFGTMIGELGFLAGIKWVETKTNKEDNNEPNESTGCDDTSGYRD